MALVVVAGAEAASAKLLAAARAAPPIKVTASKRIGRLLSPAVLPFDAGKAPTLFWAGADLLALGVASFGHIGGTHYQNHHDFDPYVSAVNAGKPPVYRALTPTDDERFIREFVLQLKLGSVSAEYFAKKFGVDPRERFAEPLQRIRDWGFAEIDSHQIKINREGLLQVDRLLHEFFLPEHRNARYT